MTTYRIRFDAALSALPVPDTPGFTGISLGLRASIFPKGGDNANSLGPSCVLVVERVIAPGESGTATIELITDGADRLRAGMEIELRSGPKIGATGVVREIELIEEMST